ncbi:MAG: hypothetical protein AAF533_25115 [Acidobacteriota bacterium]
MSHTPRNRAIVLGLAALVILTLVHWSHRRSQASGSHADEAYWVGSAYYFDLLFLQGERRHEDWQLLPGRENPALGKHVIGAWLTLSGHRTPTLDRIGLFLAHFSRAPGAWGDEADQRKREDVVQRVSPDAVRDYLQAGEITWEPGLLAAARRLNHVFHALNMMVVLALGWCLRGAVAGFVAMLITGCHPLVTQHAFWINIDLIALFFVTATALALHRVEQLGATTSRPRGALLVLLGGGCLAFACGSKMNASVIALVTAGCWLGALAGWSRERARRAPLLVLTGMIVLSLVLFVALNPTLHSDPLDGMLALIAEPRRTVEIQSAFLQGYLSEPLDRFLALGRRMLASQHPWLAIVIAAGLGQQVVMTLRRRRLDLVMAWWLVALVAVGLWLPFDWPRYSLPIVPPTALLVGRAAEDLFRTLRGRWRGGTSPVPGATGDAPG